MDTVRLVLGAPLARAAEGCDDVMVIEGRAASVRFRAFGTGREMCRAS